MHLSAAAAPTAGRPISGSQATEREATLIAKLKANDKLNLES